MNSLKKTVSVLLSLVLALMLVLPVAADATKTKVEPGSERVVIGADLTEDQILSVYSDFQIVRGSVTELKVTNAEERQYLEGLVSESTIGTRSISCVYIETLKEGEGLEVSTHNINWCTNSIYTNALITAGIYDAKVIVSAPFEVSGTAALTGIYKAFEDITGEEIDEDAKDAGTLEMVVTSELADSVGEEEATEVVNDLKSILDETGDMTDDELRSEVEKISEDHNVELTGEQIDKLVDLVRSLEKLDISTLISKVDELKNKLSGLADDSEGFFAKIWNGIKNFFKSIGDFFANLFGGGDDKEAADVKSDGDVEDGGEGAVVDDFDGDADAPEDGADDNAEVDDDTADDAAESSAETEAAVSEAPEADTAPAAE